MFDQNKYITLSMRQNALEQMVKRDKHVNVEHLKVLQDNTHELLEQLISKKEENTHDQKD